MAVKRRKKRAAKEPKPKIIWEDVLARKLVEAGLPPPIREYKFHAIRRWRADLSYPDHRLLIEVEGGVFSRGRHTRGVGYVKDMEKYNAATLDRWAILRFTPSQVRTGVAVEVVASYLCGKGVTE